MNKINFEENKFKNISSNLIKEVKMKDIQQTKNTTKTGFKNIDNCPNSDTSLNEGEICIIASRPGNGKSTLFHNIALNNARNGKKVLIVSCNLSKENIISTILPTISNIEVNYFFTKQLSESQLNIISEKLDENEYLSNIHIVSENYLTIFKLTEIIEEYKNKYKIDTVFIDNIQLIRLPNGMLPLEHEDQNLINALLSTSLKRLRLTSYILSNVNSRCEHTIEKMPHPLDIQYSESFIDSAKLILTLCRPKLYYINKYKNDIIDINVYSHTEKLLNTTNLEFYGPTQTIRNI